MAQDEFTWVAIYQDGTHFPKYDPETGAERSSEQIDRRRLASFSLVYRGSVLLTQHLDPGQRLIYRRRTMVSQQTGEKEICHLVGWQETVADQNIQHVCYVFERDRRIEMAGRFREDHKWFGRIEPVAADLVARE